MIDCFDWFVFSFAQRSEKAQVFISIKFIPGSHVDVNHLLWWVCWSKNLQPLCHPCSVVISLQFQFHFYMDSLHLATFHLITSCSRVIQDAEESGLPNSEENNLQEHSESTKDTKDSVGAEQDTEDRVYLDLVPVRSFLHTSCGGKTPPAKETSRHSPVPTEDQKDPSSQRNEVGQRDLLKCICYICCICIYFSGPKPFCWKCIHCILCFNSILYALIPGHFN